MTPQEAIKRIKHHNELHSRAEKHFAIRITKALNMAVEALEKQIPKKTTERQYTPNGTLIYGHCPNCGWFTKNTFNYCGKCGKALDWGEHDASNS